MVNKKTIPKLSKSDKIIIYSAILILLIIIILILSLRASYNYHEFRETKNYFGTTMNPLISSWMTPDTILRHFNINEEDLFRELEITESESSLRTPLYRICLKKNINCPDLINELNSLIK
jgi:hypothetical protein